MSRKLLTVANEGNPNKVGDVNRAVKLGSALKLGHHTIIASVVDDQLVLPENAKAQFLLAVYSSAGTATGPLTPVAGAPAAGEVGLSLTGDIVFAAADAVEEAEVTYQPIEGDVLEVGGVTSATGLLSMSSVISGRMVLEATVAGASRTVVARGSAPGVGEAALTVDGKGIQFNAADAGLVGLVKLIGLDSPSVAERLVGEVDF